MRDRQEPLKTQGFLVASLRAVLRRDRGIARTVGATFKDEAYGIALPQGSPLREKINTTLLELQGDGTYLQLYNKWFTG